MSNAEEIVAQIKSLGATFHSLKTSKAEGAEVEAVLSEINTLKASYEQLTGTPFEGGTVLLTPRRPAQESTVMPPAPPSPADEAAAEVAPPSTYASRLIHTATKLVGRKRHGTPLFDANAIARFLLENMTADPAHKALLGGTDAQKEEVTGWMAFASKVDGTPQEEYAAALGWQLRSVLAPGTQLFFVTGSDAPTMADVALFLALAVCPLPEDSFEPNTLAWRGTVGAFVASIENQADPESPLPTPRAPYATTAAEAHLASIPKITEADGENALPAQPSPPAAAATTEAPSAEKPAPAEVAPTAAVQAMGIQKDVTNVLPSATSTA